MSNYIVFAKDDIKVEVRGVDDVELKPEGDLWFWKDIEIEDNPDVRAESISVFAAGSWDFYLKEGAGDVFIRETQEYGE